MNTDTNTSRFDPIPRLQQIAATIEESGADIFDAPATAVHYINCAIKEIERLRKEPDKDITQMIRKDITERLRDRDNHDSLEAADEIERLRKELETLHQRIKDIKEGFEGCCNACEPVGEMNKQLRKERDEARQEICEAYCDSLGVLLGSPTTPRDYAWRRGWDCYKNENPHA